MREIHHDNGDVTVTWYGYEEMSKGIIIANIVLYIALALGIVMPSTVFTILVTVVLGTVLGVCMTGIIMLVDGHVKYSETYYADNA